MKKRLIFLFLMILISGLVSACQYPDIRFYDVQERWFYQNHALIGINLDMPSLVKVELVGSQIKATNNLEVPVALNISYHKYSKWFGFDSDVYQLVEIKKQDSVLIDTFLKDCGGFECSLSNLDYEFSKPYLITNLLRTITKNETICRTCPNGKQCLGDGASCELGIECGSGICNIDQKCGVIGSPPIVPCSDGKLNCNDSACSKPSVKTDNEAYSCDWQCQNGTIPCDGICKAVSAKKTGQEYSCIEQCKSGKGNGKICVWNVRQWIYFSIATLFMVLTILFAIFYKTLGGIIKRLSGQRKDLEGTLNKLDLELTNRRDKIKESNKVISDLEKEKSNLGEMFLEKQKEFNKKLASIKLKENKEIEKLKQKKGQASKEAEIKINEEIRKKDKVYQDSIATLRESFLKDKDKYNRLKNENKLKIEEEIRKRHSLDLADKDLEDKKAEIKKENLIVEQDKRENHIQRLLNEYQREYEHGSSTVFYDKSRRYFRIKFNDGKEYDLHRHIYYNYLDKNLFGKEVHHIDYDELNNNRWNLIALPERKHNKSSPEAFKHGSIPKGDWPKGYTELKRQLNMKDSDFPKHIQEHAKKLGLN